MAQLKTLTLDIDQIIKAPTINPYQITKIEKVVLHINHNPIINNKYKLYPAIAASIELTNLYPQIKKATASYASFNLRRGMQFSLLTTMRGPNIKYFYYKFMFVLLPVIIRTLDNSSTIYRKVNSNGYFSIGLSLNTNISGNILFVLNNADPKFYHLNCFYNSYYLLPFTVK